MLDLIDLRAGYNGNQIIRNINLNVKKGSISSLIGRNGSGKSTVLKSIYGLCDLYSGKIIFNNKEIQNIHTSDLIYRGINYIPQEQKIFYNMTVIENLEMGGVLIKNKSEVINIIKNIIKLFPLFDKKIYQKAYTLSGGQQRILAIARALVIKPKLLILDEPFSGLDEKSIDMITKYIIKLNNKGLTVLMTEQNLPKILKISDNIIAIKNGLINKTCLNDKKKSKHYLRLYK